MEPTILCGDRRKGTVSTVAHIFAGELSMIDQEVFDVLKHLPDSFWVFAEFNIGRNIDWFIIRPDEPSTLILTELKRINKPLRGAVNGLWEKQTASGDWEELPASGTDTNPYWQAVNSANALADWLWNNQQLYRETGDIRPSGDFRVWPDLLLLSPPGTTHRLPLAPPSRYGRWWFNVDDWLRHVRGWTPRTGVSLIPQEVANLVEALRLTEIWGGGDVPDALSTPEPALFGSAQPAGSTPNPAPPIASPVPTAGSASAALGFANWALGLEQRIARLEQEMAQYRDRVQELELELERAPLEFGDSDDSSGEDADADPVVVRAGEPSGLA